MNHQVLVVEDEQIVALDLRMCLEALGYDVACETSGEAAIETASRLKPAIVLMDIHLDGDLDGIEAAGQIRREADIPVVFLTAYADSRTISRAAAASPSGYVVKPFNERGLAATMYLAIHKSQSLRRVLSDESEEPAGPRIVSVGALEIDVARRRVLRGGMEIRLTRKEFDLLYCLAGQPGVAIPSEQLLSKAWGPQFVHYVQALRVHLGNLRQKVESGSGIRIEAVRGVGYRLLETGRRALTS